MPRGGVRKGAGRPDTGRKRLVLYVTDVEREQLLELFNRLRLKKDDDNV